MFYYRFQEIRYDESFFIYLENEKKYNKDEFQQHVEEAYFYWLKKHPDKLRLLTTEQTEHFTDRLNEVLPILKKKFGYASVNVEQTLEYETEEHVQQINGLFKTIDLVKKRQFTSAQIVEEGRVNIQKDYGTYFNERKFRKRGKELLKEKEYYLYRIKEKDGDFCYLYPLIHANRWNKMEFCKHLNVARKILKEEKGPKPIIGIDLAKKLCELFDYEPIYVEVTAKWEFLAETIPDKNRFGFAFMSTGRVEFEEEYWYRRDAEEDEMIEGDQDEFIYYFSLAHCQNEEPKLIKINKKWYAYHERRRGHLRSKIKQEDVKMIFRSYHDWNYNEYLSAKYSLYYELVEEAIDRSASMKKPKKVK